jgi:hypothetical protein
MHADDDSFVRLDLLLPVLVRGQNRAARRGRAGPSRAAALPACLPSRRGRRTPAVTGATSGLSATHAAGPPQEAAPRQRHYWGYIWDGTGSRATQPIRNPANKSHMPEEQVGQGQQRCMPGRPVPFATALAPPLPLAPPSLPPLFAFLVFCQPDPRPPPPPAQPLPLPLPRLQYPLDTYPPFASGCGFVLSHDLAAALVRQALPDYRLLVGRGAALGMGLGALGRGGGRGALLAVLRLQAGRGPGCWWPPTALPTHSLTRTCHLPHLSPPTRPSTGPPLWHPPVRQRVLRAGAAGGARARRARAPLQAHPNLAQQHHRAALPAARRDEGPVQEGGCAGGQAPGGGSLVGAAGDAWRRRRGLCCAPRRQGGADRSAAAGPWAGPVPEAWGRELGPGAGAGRPR